MFKNKYSIISTTKYSTIDLHIYDNQILDSFSINEFAWIRCTVQEPELHGVNCAELFNFGRAICSIYTVHETMIIIFRHQSLVY